MRFSCLVFTVLLQQLALAQTTPGATCEDQYVEMGREPIGMPREVCISPGLVTTFVSDVPMASMDVQEEVLFEEVMRGRRILGLMPPRDLQPGERRRLTLTLRAGDVTQQVSFMLVAHRGQATRQVEVFLDSRSPASLRGEIEQERASNHRLHQENERLRWHIQRTRGLSLLLSTDAVWTPGPSIKESALKNQPEPGSDFWVERAMLYRTLKTIAVRVWLHNSSPVAWSAVGVSLVDAHGSERPGLQWSQEKPLAPDGGCFFVVEADAGATEPLSPLTLKLWDAEGRSITLPQLVFP